MREGTVKTWQLLLTELRSAVELRGAMGRHAEYTGHTVSAGGRHGARGDSS